MNRKVLAVLALVALTVSSGCLGFFSSDEVSDERLAEEPAAPYAWNESARAHITVTEGAKFRAVYRLNESELKVFRRDGFGSRNAIPIRAVRYRYPNGTVVDGAELKARGGEVTQSRSVTTVALPSDAPPGGKLAFTAGSTPKRFAIPTFVEGSYEVVLPEGRRVTLFPFGNVVPRGYSLTEDDRGRTHITWSNVSADSILVQFYLQRDLYIFGAIAASLVVVGAIGALYYRRKITALQEEREELGLDVDVDDDDRRGPPPGMR
jgi:hypothetical protein